MLWLCMSDCTDGSGSSTLVVFENFLVFFFLNFQQQYPLPFFPEIVYFPGSSCLISGVVILKWWVNHRLNGFKVIAHL